MRHNLPQIQIYDLRFVCLQMHINLVFCKNRKHFPKFAKNKVFGCFRVNFALAKSFIFIELKNKSNSVNASTVNFKCKLGSLGVMTKGHLINNIN